MVAAMTSISNHKIILIALFLLLSQVRIAGGCDMYPVETGILCSEEATLMAHEWWGWHMRAGRVLGGQPPHCIV